MNAILRMSRNLGLIMWARVVTVLVSLAFLSIAARRLTVSGFGSLVFVLAAASLMEMVFAGTSDAILLRNQASKRGTTEENFRACLSLHSAFGLVILVSVTGMAWFFRLDATLSRGLLLAGISSVAQVMFAIPVAMFRATENMRFEAMLITGERLLFLGVFCAVIMLHGGIVSILGCLALSMALKCISAYWWLFRVIPCGDLRFALPGAWGYLKESAPLIGVAIAFGIHWRLDLFIIKLGSSAQQVGIYAASFRLMEMLRVLPVDVIAAAFPVFCKLANSSRNDFSSAYNSVVRGSLIIAASSVILGWSCSEMIVVALFGRAYLAAMLPLRILLLAFPLVFWNQVHNIALTANAQQKWTFYALLPCLAVQAAADLALVPSRGALGAATGFSLGEVILLAATIVAILRIHVPVRRVAGVAVRLAIAGACVFMVASVLSPKVTSVGIAIVSGLLLACFLLMFRLISKSDLELVRAIVFQRSGAPAVISKGMS